MDTNLVLFWGMVLFVVVVGAALLMFRKEMRGDFTAEPSGGTTEASDTLDKV